MTNSLRREFSKNGFVILKSIIDKSKIDNLRKEILKEHTDFNGHRGIDYVLTKPQLYNLQFNEKIIDGLSSIFGKNIYYVNDFDLQINNPDNRGKYDGWHVDCGSELSRIERYLFDSDYSFAKVGLYLQDNTDDYGGGIDVEPGSHLAFKYSNNLKIALLYYYFDRFFFKKFRKIYRVPIKAGDCIVFDQRLFHASSAPNISIKNIPQNNKKITFYFECGIQRDAESYLRNCVIRSITENNSKSFFANCLRHNFPEDYPKDYISNVLKINGLKICTLNKKKSELFEGIWKELNIDTFIQHDG